MKARSSSLNIEKEFELEEEETYQKSLDELVKLLKSDLKRGLIQSDAEERLRVVGQNVIPAIKPSLFKSYIAPFLNWLINIYLIISTLLAFFALFVLPEIWGQVAQWLSIIAVNSFIAIVQQNRAQAKLEALQRLSELKSKVIRDNSLIEISSEQLVPGDIIKLEQGDIIPVDARIISSSSLKVNEAALTGESNEVEKFEKDTSFKEKIPIFSRKNMLFRGTHVTTGNSIALVVKTGRGTEIGKISKNVEELETGEILLRRKINTLAKYLAFAVLIYIAISLTNNFRVLYLRGDLFPEGALNLLLVSRTIVRSLITAMSIMPINIPLLTTIILLTGVIGMIEQKVVIRDINTVETLGRVSVVGSDKTGTITKNEMTVKWICIPPSTTSDFLYGVTGVGFNPKGEILAIDSSFSFDEMAKKELETYRGNEIEIQTESPLEYILISGMLNNDSTIVEDRKKIEDENIEPINFSILGDATDVSISYLFYKSKLDEKSCKSRFEEVGNYPFESKLRRMTKIFKDHEKRKYVVFTKGATEVLLDRSNYLTKSNIASIKGLDSEDRSLIENWVNKFASSGYRVISFAFRYIDEMPIDADREFFENHLTYLGFVAIIDPPRAEVRESVIEAKNAGIKLVMITGDSIETGRSIAEQVGIAEGGDLAVRGSDAESLSDEEFFRTSVFSRVSPDQKMTIVERYKYNDQVVSVTGDGINDAQAICAANVGIAMGITGTDVAKQVADMIVTDDSFTSIITGIRYGRGLFQKIRSIIFFYISVNLAEALIYFGASLIPDFYLLNTWQHVYLFITAHSLPPFALIMDRLSRDVMKEKPRDSEEIFNKKLEIALVIFSLSLALIFFTTYFGTLNGVIPVFEGNKMGYTPNFNAEDYQTPVNWAQAKARTMFHTVAFVSECALIISLRRINKPINKTLKENNNWLLWPFILLVPLLHLILMFFPASQSILMQSLGLKLEVIQLTLIDWIIAITFGFIPIFLLESYKIWLQRQSQYI